ncbi:hypothetical protein IJ732_03835 [bacterium]|nr:hypothetical protein [bacterium]
MSEIKKFSREWFAGRNGMQDKQKEAASKLKNGYENSYAQYGFLERNTFVGEREEVTKNFNNRDVNSLKSENYIIRQYGGIDNLFDLIDTDGDGVITDQEFSEIANVDGEEMGRVSELFSARDLRTIYENAVGAEDAVVEKDDFIEHYEYKDGMSTDIFKNDEGGVAIKYTEVNAENDERKGTGYIYDSQIKYDVIKDSKGRIRYMAAHSDIDKSRNAVKTTEYDDENDKRVVTLDTPGRTIVNTYAKDVITDRTQTLKYESDRAIGNTNQASIGDCWILAGVNALNDTPKGKQIIEDSIKQHEDGSVTVTLKGVNKSYFYTPEQIGAKQYTSINKLYSRGDIDMNLIEMAITDYRKEKFEQNNITSDMSLASKDDPINGGRPENTVFLLTGQEFVQYSRADKKDKILDQKRKHDDRYVMTVDFKQPDTEIGNGESIVSGHAYSINRVTEDTVYVVNPWNSAEEIPYPKDKFLENSNSVFAFKMKK